MHRTQCAQSRQRVLRKLERLARAESAQTQVLHGRLRAQEAREPRIAPRGRREAAEAPRAAAEHPRERAARAVRELERERVQRGQASQRAVQQPEERRGRLVPAPVDVELVHERGEFGRAAQGFEELDALRRAEWRGVLGVLGEVAVDVEVAVEAPDGKGVQRRVDIEQRP